MTSLILLLLTAAPHPLEALTSAELKTAVSVLRAHPGFPTDAVFASLELQEPEKGKSSARAAFAVVFSRGANGTFEAEVSLSEKKVTAWTPVEGVQAMVLFDEYDRVTEAVRADPRWQEAMKKRGITDFARVNIDGWAAGPAYPPARRVMRAISFYRGENKNYYNRPVEGVVAVVDLAAPKVLEVIDTGVVPVAERGYDFDLKSTQGKRKASKPLVTTQPQGVDYQLRGSEVRWQGWSFHFTFNPREGLVLHRVAYDERSILHRASLSEMIVPYGDPDPNWSWRAAFDVGEYGFGNLTSPLMKGADVPAHARLIDAALVDSSGKPRILAGALAIHERDGGVLWKHYDAASNQNYVRRGRQLVVTTAAAIGNYDYLLSWIFHQDGTLELDVALTGILLGKGAEASSQDKDGLCPGCSGHRVDVNVIAPNHQHFFSFRLDLDVDGPANALTEMNQRAIPKGAMNPAGNGFVMQESELLTEAEARRMLDPGANRHWRVTSTTRKNALGNRSGYLLVPHGNTPPYLLADSPSRKRAAFLEHALWATRYREGERFAAGPYPNQAPVDRGLSLWSNGEPLSGEDLVVWYTMGLSHVPREEEWPIMGAHHVGFKLVPAGFFDRNPALDVR
jgi:primary-amine oxidase